jgi:hypothetical protein
MRARVLVLEPGIAGEAALRALLPDDARPLAGDGGAGA